MSGQPSKKLRSAASKGKGASRDLPVGSPAPGRDLDLEEQLQTEQSIGNPYGHTPRDLSDEDDVDINTEGDPRDPEVFGQGRAPGLSVAPSTGNPTTQGTARIPSEDGMHSQTLRATHGAPAGAARELSIPSVGGVTRDLQDENRPAGPRHPSQGMTPLGSNTSPLIGSRHEARPLEQSAGASPSNGTFLESLLRKLFAAEDAGAPLEETQRLHRQIELAKLTLVLPAGAPTERPRTIGDDASRLMNTLSKVTPKPKLGSDSRVPTPQQVAQWATDIETLFRSVHAVEDSDTRTYWALNTIQYNVHRELLQQKMNEKLIRTWAELLTEQRRLVQDPILTKFQNYGKFFNFVWRDGDSMNSFMLQLGKREGLLERSFFKLPDGRDDDELKIAFIWSKIPEPYRRELQRNGSLKTIHTWEEFERALRDAETALAPADSAKAPRGVSDDGQAKGKRNASGQFNPKATGKKQDRKPSSQGFQQRRQSPSGGDSSSRNQSRSSQGGDSRSDTQERRWENKNPHWRNKDHGDSRRQEQGPKRDNARDDAGKDKP